MSLNFNSVMQRVVDSRGLTVTLMLAISSIAFIGYYDHQLLLRWFQSDKPNAASEDNLDDRVVNSSESVAAFSFAADSVLVVQSPDIFTPEGSAALRKIVEDLESLDIIDNVTWFDEIPMLNVFSMPQPVLPHETASSKRFELAKAKALLHPFIRGQLLSEKGDTALLLVRFNRFFLQTDDDVIGKIRDQAEATSINFPNFSADFTVTGSLPLWLTALSSHEANTFYYQIIGYSMIGLMSIILFRGLAAVFVVALAPSIAVFWTIGFIQFFEYQNNPFNDVVLPVLVSLIALTDGVHLMVEIRKFRAAGLAPKNAAIKGAQKVGLACALTSLTTAIGFGSLALANHELVRQFGYSCVVGVILSFVAVVTAIPLVCSGWVGRFVQAGQDKSLVDKNLNRIGVVIDTVMIRKKPVAIIGVVSTIVFILVSLGLRPDERQSRVIPDSSEAARGLRIIDQEMRGIERAEVSISWDQSIKIDDPAIVQVHEKVDQLLEEEELIGHPLSILKLIDSLPGDGNPEDRFSMLELLPPSLKRAFLVEEECRANITFRVRDLGIASYDPVFRRIQTGLSQIENEHPQFRFGLSGDAVWRWENLFQIVIDLATSLGTAVVIIFLVLAVVYRSLTIGLISLIPNLFPLAVSGVYLVVTQQALEVVTVCAFTVCLGIAVDDTIHFLTRYQEEIKGTADRNLAIRNAFTGVGTALILTTIVLVSGFGTVLFSDSRDHFIFASMGMITLSAALFADLVFLPAMLAFFTKSTDC